MTDNHRQVVYAGNRSLEVRSSPSPQPGPGEVEVSIAYTGICGTDLHIFHGQMDARVAPPAVLGHEMSGIVASVGPGVTAWAPGDRVTARPLRPDGACRTCRRGAEHVCPNLDFIGIDSPGSMQERWIVPESTLFRLPDSLDLKVGALIEPLAVACHSVRRARLKAGDFALVTGAGPIGTLIALVALANDANVLISEPSEDRRRGARSLDLNVVDPVRDDLDAVIESWTGGDGIDVGFEAAAAPRAVNSIVDNLSPRGRLAPVGIHSAPVPVALFDVFWKELEIIGSRLYGREDYETAIDLAASGSLPLSSLISDVVPMDSAPDAFSSLERGEAMKILVECGADQS